MKFRSILFIGWCVMVLRPMGLQAQLPSFSAQHYTVSNSGLSHNSVLNLTEDQYGFIWISTMDGLNRFDGVSMKVYEHNPDDSTTLSDSFVHGILKHNDGTLWVGTRDGGISVIDPVTDNIRRIMYEPGNPLTIPNAPVSLVYQDGKNRMWMSFFSSSLGYFDEESEEFHPLYLTDRETGKPLDSINSILEMNDGSFIITTLTGVYVISGDVLDAFSSNPLTKRAFPADSFPFNRQAENPNSNNVYIDNEGGFWVENLVMGLIKIPVSQIPEAAQQSLDSGVRASSAKNIIVEREGVLIQGANNGHINVIDKASELIQQVQIIDTETTTGGSRIFEDSTGDIWYYPWGSGLYKLEEPVGIRLFRNTADEQPLASNFILAFDEDESGNLLIGTNSGLSKLSPDHLFMPVTGIPDALNESSIWSLNVDDTGIWVATRSNGLFHLKENGSEYSVKNFTPENSVIAQYNVHQVLRDSRGWLWLGYEGSGIQIIKNTDAWLSAAPAELTQLSQSEQGEGIILNTDFIRRIYEDQSGNIWIASSKTGFTRLQIENGAITATLEFTADTSGDITIPHNDGRSILQDASGDFWFTTYGGGIFKWNEGNEFVTVFTKQDGLANNSTYGVIADQNTEAVWISTNGGLSRLNTNSMEFTTFTESDGLQNNEFNTGAYFSRVNGELVFGGVNGFNILNTTEIDENLIPPDVYITSINLFNEPLDSDTASLFKKELRLPYNDNFLSFTFAALDYDSPPENEYAYLMEGVDNDWVYSGNRTFADYPGLDPGSYTFRVKAANSDGIWNEAGTSLSVEITPPWWQTTIFRLMAGLIIIVGFAGTVRYWSQRKLRIELRRMEVENKLRNERERISRDLHDHVGAQLANIISGLSLIDKYNEVKETEKSSRLMNSIKGDAEVTIKQLRDTIWALNQNELTIEAFRDHLRTYFKSQSALTAQIDVTVESEVQNNSQLSATQALNLFRVIQEAAQNTLKYSGASEFTVHLEEKNDALRIRIKDNGTFRQSEGSYNSGYGMQNMQKRVNEINGELNIDIENGTVIHIEVPV